MQQTHLHVLWDGIDNEGKDNLRDHVLQLRAYHIEVDLNQWRCATQYISTTTTTPTTPTTTTSIELLFLNNWIRQVTIYVMRSAPTIWHARWWVIRRLCGLGTFNLDGGTRFSVLKSGSWSWLCSKDRMVEKGWGHAKGGGRVFDLRVKQRQHSNTQKKMNSFLHWRSL